MYTHTHADMSHFIAPHHIKLHQTPVPGATAVMSGEV